MQHSPFILRLIAFTFGIASSIGCGDDGGGGETDGSSTGGASTGAASTTMEVETTTGAEGTTGGGESSSGPQDSSGTSAPGTEDSGGSEDTGSAGDCPALRDPETCDGTKGCLWVGNPQNGQCLSEDPAVCPELEMQTCQQHPACEWSNQDAACSDPA